MTVIDPTDVTAMMAVILGLTWLGFLFDGSRIGKAVPGVVAILVTGLLLSNLHLTAFSSPVADFVGQYVVVAAIPLLMIKADLKAIFVESGRVMLGFVGACVGIVLGVFAGYFLLQPWHVGPQFAGFYTGGFIGGTISMIAVANAVQMSPSEISVATGASMIPSVLGLMTLVALPGLPLVRRLLPSRRVHAAGAEPSAGMPNAPTTFSVTHVTGALALSLGICALARVAELFVAPLVHHDQHQYNILYVTTLTVLIANLFPRQLRRLRGEFDLGMIFMYMFFAMIGLGTNVTSFLANALSLFFYVIMLLAIGIVVALVLARLMRLDLAEAVTGLGAAIVGPVATVAVVAGKGWNAMISPAVMTGIFCHIVGNFAGIMVVSLLR